MNLKGFLFTLFRGLTKKIMSSYENLPPKVLKEVAKELNNLVDTPPEGIRVLLNDDLSSIFADIEGPVGTPYEGGLFRLKLVLSRDFPLSPPKGYFMTKPFHPNIANNGEICVNTLKKDWKPTLGLRHVLIVIRCLLIEPFPESALNEHAGRLLMESYEEYAKHARLHTSIHAMKHKAKNKAISESTVVNAGPTNDAVLPSVPHAPCNINKENVPVPNVGSMENVGIGVLLKKMDAPAKVTNTKKKVDPRKKTLRRL